MGSQVNKLWAPQLAAHTSSRQAANGGSSRADMVACPRSVASENLDLLFGLGVEIIFGPDPRCAASSALCFSRCHLRVAQDTAAGLTFPSLVCMGPGDKKQKHA